MKTTSARTRTATLAALLAAATFGVSTAQSAISRLPAGGNSVWHVNRTSNINLKTPRGSQAFANWFTVGTVRQPTMVLQPVIAYYPNPDPGSIIQQTPYTIGLQTSLLASCAKSASTTTVAYITLPPGLLTGATGAVTKTGSGSSGMLTIGGTSSYSGSTIVSGSLTYTGSVVDTTTNLSGSSGTLTIGGVNSYGYTTISSGSTRIVTGTGTLNTTSGYLDLNSLYGTSGTLTLGGTTYDYTPGSSRSLILTPTSGSITAISGSYTGSSGSASFVSVPEPTSIGLLLCTGGWLLGRRRR